jgi:taurine dioxygenase
MRISSPLPGTIGAEITDLNAAALTAEQAQHIRQALYTHKLVVFRGQKLQPAEYIEFARRLGRPQIYFQKNYHHPEHPELFVSSNIPVNGKKMGVAGTGRYWHTDYQFFKEPLPFVMVYPQVLPSRGQRATYFIDMVRVYEELPDELRRYVEGRRAIQDAKWRYKITPEDVDRSLFDLLKDVEKLVPPVTHPAIIEHPVTLKKSLYISSGFTEGIEGLSHDENKAVMAKLFAFIEKEDRVHTHPWQMGDILMWDNRQLIHKASSTEPGEPNMSYRIGVYDELPFYTNA